MRDSLKSCTFQGSHVNFYLCNVEEVMINDHILNEITIYADVFDLLFASRTQLKQSTKMLCT